MPRGKTKSPVRRSKTKGTSSRRMPNPVLFNKLNTKDQEFILNQLKPSRCKPDLNCKVANVFCKEDLQKITKRILRIDPSNLNRRQMCDLLFEYRKLNLEIINEHRKRKELQSKSIQKGRELAILEKGTSEKLKESRKKLRELNKNIGLLNKEKTKLKGQLTRETSKNKKLQSGESTKVKTLQNKIAKLEKAIDNLSNKRSKEIFKPTVIEEMAKEKQVQLKQAYNKIEEKQHEMSDILDIARMTKKQAKEPYNKLKKLDGILKKEQMSLQEIQRKKEMTENKLEELKKELESKEIQERMLTYKKNQAPNYSDKLKKQIARNQDILAMLNSDERSNKSLVQEIQKLKKQLRMRQSQLDESEVKLKHIQKQLKKNKEMSKEYTQELEEDLEEERVKITDKKAAILNLKSELRILTSDNKKKEEEIEKLSRKNRDLHRQMTNYPKFKQAASELDNVRREKKQLEQQVKKLERDMTDVKADTQAKLRSYNRIEAERNNLAAEINTVRAELGQLNTELDQAKQDKKDAEQERDTVSLELEQLKNSSSATSNELADAKSKLRAAEQNVQDTETKIKDLNKKFGKDIINLAATYNDDEADIIRKKDKKEYEALDKAIEFYKTKTTQARRDYIDYLYLGALAGKESEVFKANSARYHKARANASYGIKSVRGVSDPEDELEKLRAKLANDLNINDSSPTASQIAQAIEDEEKKLQISQEQKELLDAAKAKKINTKQELEDKLDRIQDLETQISAGVLTKEQQEDLDRLKEIKREVKQQFGVDLDDPNVPVKDLEEKGEEFKNLSSLYKELQNSTFSIVFGKTPKELDAKQRADVITELEKKIKDAEQTGEAALRSARQELADLRRDIAGVNIDEIKKVNSGLAEVLEAAGNLTNISPGSITKENIEDIQQRLATLEGGPKKADLDAAIERANDLKQKVADLEKEKDEAEEAARLAAKEKEAAEKQAAKEIAAAEAAAKAAEAAAKAATAAAKPPPPPQKPGPPLSRTGCQNEIDEFEKRISMLRELEDALEKKINFITKRLKEDSIRSQEAKDTAQQMTVDKTFETMLNKLKELPGEIKNAETLLDATKLDQNGQNCDQIKNMTFKDIIGVSGVFDREQQNKILDLFENVAGIGRIYVRLGGNKLPNTGKDQIVEPKELTRFNTPGMMLLMDQSKCGSSTSGQGKIKFGPYTQVFDNDGLTSNRLDPGKDIESTTNKSVYRDSIQTKILNMLKVGYNTVTMVYGQSGSGKTYTLAGGYSKKGGEKGLVHHAIEDVINSGKVSNIDMAFIQMYFPASSAGGTRGGDGAFFVTPTQEEVDNFVNSHPNLSEGNFKNHEGQSENALFLENNQTLDFKTLFTQDLQLKSLVGKGELKFDMEKTQGNRDIFEQFWSQGDSLQNLNEKFNQRFMEVMRARPTRATAINPESSRSHLFIIFKIKLSDNTEILMTFIDLGGNEETAPSGSKKAKDVEGDMINSSLDSITFFMRRYASGHTYESFLTKRPERKNRVPGAGGETKEYELLEIDSLGPKVKRNGKIPIDGLQAIIRSKQSDTSYPPYTLKAKDPVLKRNIFKMLNSIIDIQIEEPKTKISLFLHVHSRLKNRGGDYRKINNKICETTGIRAPPASGFVVAPGTLELGDIIFENDNKAKGGFRKK
jgi:hypothetical protein